MGIMSGGDKGEREVSGGLRDLKDVQKFRGRILQKWAWQMHPDRGKQACGTTVKPLRGPRQSRDQSWVLCSVRQEALAVF